jgi:DnaK suppressor protein
MKEVKKKLQTEDGDKVEQSKVKSPYENDFQYYMNRLLDIQDRLLDEIQFHAADNLKRTSQDASSDLSAYKYHMADAASDNSDREFSLSMVSNRQETLYEIEAAIKRLETGVYGICEKSGQIISKERLEVIPWARFTAACQEEFERTNKKRVQSFDPFAEESDVEVDEDKISEEVP